MMLTRIYTHHVIYKNLVNFKRAYHNTTENALLGILFMDSSEYSNQPNVFVYLCKWTNATHSKLYNRHVAMHFSDAYLFYYV